MIITNNDDVQFIKNELASMGFDDDELEEEISNSFFNKQLEEQFIGSTGFAQVGEDDYYEKQKFEYNFLKKHILDKFKKMPEDTYFKWKSFPHDFGSYYSLVYYCDLNNPSHAKFYEKLESFDWESLCDLINPIYTIEKLGKPPYWTDEQIAEDNKIFDLLNDE